MRPMWKHADDTDEDGPSLKLRLALLCMLVAAGVVISLAQACQSLSGAVTQGVVSKLPL